MPKFKCEDCFETFESLETALAHTRTNKTKNVEHVCIRWTPPLKDERELVKEAMRLISESEYSAVMDAEVDSGEFSGPAHERLLEKKLVSLAKEYEVSRTRLEELLEIERERLDIRPKFCFVCGQSLRMRYPQNDPEVGPAQPRCPDDAHPTFEEHSYAQYSDEYYREALERLSTDYRETPQDPETPSSVRLAAAHIIDYLQEQARRAEQEAADYFEAHEREVRKGVS